MKSKITLLMVCVLTGILLMNTFGVVYGSNFDIQPAPPSPGRKGVIDGIITGRSIIINDCSFKLTDKTNYNRPGNLNCSGRWFKKKDRIYYLLEPGTRVVKTIWLAGGKYRNTSTP